MNCSKEDGLFLAIAPSCKNAKVNKFLMSTYRGADIDRLPELPGIEIVGMADMYG